MLRCIPRLLRSLFVLELSSLNQRKNLFFLVLFQITTFFITTELRHSTIFLHQPQSSLLLRRTPKRMIRRFDLNTSPILLTLSSTNRHIIDLWKKLVIRRTYLRLISHEFISLNDLLTLVLIYFNLRMIPLISKVVNLSHFSIVQLHLHNLVLSLQPLDLLQQFFHLVRIVVHSLLQSIPLTDSIKQLLLLTLLLHLVLLDLATRYQNLLLQLKHVGMNIALSLDLNLTQLTRHLATVHSLKKMNHLRNPRRNLSMKTFFQHTLHLLFSSIYPILSRQNYILLLRKIFLNTHQRIQSGQHHILIFIDLHLISQNLPLLAIQKVLNHQLFTLTSAKKWRSYSLFL